MIVGIWRASFLVPFLEKEAPGSWIGPFDVWHSTMTVTAYDIVLISKWFVMIVCSCSAEVFKKNVLEFRPCLGMTRKVSLEGMPCNFDLYLYSDIEVLIGLIQKIPFLRSQVVLQIILSCDCGRHIGCV